jgi:hypothetical protein
VCENGAPQFVKATRVKGSIFELAREQKRTLTEICKNQNLAYDHLKFHNIELEKIVKVLKRLTQKELHQLLTEHSLMSQTYTPNTLDKARAPTCPIQFEPIEQN